MPANITPPLPTSSLNELAHDAGCPEIPQFLRVENRTPLTSEQRAHLDAALAAARAPQQARDDLRALQLATRKEKSRVRIEKLLARKSGAAARMPLTGRAALVAINQTKNLPVRANPPRRGRPRRNEAGSTRKRRARNGHNMREESYAIQLERKWGKSSPLSERRLARATQTENVAGGTRSLGCRHS